MHMGAGVSASAAQSEKRDVIAKICAIAKDDDNDDEAKIDANKKERTNSHNEGI